jgi:phage gpG-like protein
MRFTIAVSGDVQFDRTIEAVGTGAGANIDKALRDIAKDLRKVTEKQFRSEGAYASGGWPALSDAYAKRKARMVASGKVINGRRAKQMEILRLTDRLRDSLLMRHHGEHVEHIFNHALTWGTTVPYARFHQNPGPMGGKRRRFLELPEERRQAYARAILTQIRTGKNGL